MKGVVLAMLFGPASAVVGKYCLTDSDCGGAGYCQRDPTKQALPVYNCHGGAPDDVCRGDPDCPASYCLDDSSKSPVANMYLCHVGAKPAISTGFKTETCETDSDCVSYCENDPTKTAPYSCHGIGGTCETDADCTGYCENDPTKTPPYSCHMPNPLKFTKQTYVAY